MQPSKDRRYSITSSALAMAIGECREEHHVEGRAR
jgi:hypothetical protein